MLAMIIVEGLSKMEGNLRERSLSEKPRDLE